MNLSLAAAQPEGKVFVAVDIDVGVTLSAWILYGATWTYRAPLAYSPTVVRENETTSLTLAANAAAVETTVGSYFWDGTYLYVRPTTGIAFAKTIQALLRFNFSSPDPRVLNNTLYLPRIKSAPNLRQAIEPLFGGVSQIGGGSLTLINSDGFFDSKADWDWDAGQVSFWVGVDTSLEEAVWGNFTQIATFVVDSWVANRGEFILQLKEPKNRIRSEIPVATFDRATYPNIDDTNVGKAIPIAYGQILSATPTLVDPGTKLFKLAGHQIVSVDGVRVKRTKEEIISKTFIGWQNYAVGIYRLYVPGVTIRTVRDVSGATIWPPRGSLTEVTQTLADGWYYGSGWLYVRIGNIFAFSPDNLVIEYSISSGDWTPADFSAVDLINATVTLGSNYNLGDEVSVDFTGKPDANGDPITRPPEIIKDLLTTAGETNIDTLSFGLASFALQIGKTSSKNVYVRGLSFYISDRSSIIDIISQVCTYGQCFVFTNGAGAFSCTTWNPYNTATQTIDETVALDYSLLEDSTTTLSKLNLTYANRATEGFRQFVTVENTGTQFSRNQPNPVDLALDTPFPNLSDALYYGQSIIKMRSQPLKKLRIKMKWAGLLYSVGDFVTVNLSTRGITGRWEIVERDIDLSNSEVSYLLGNVRGYGNSIGWLVSDLTAIPSSYSSLTGYGTGDPTWNASWDPAIKAWAIQNLGYWTDDNGFAAPTDPASQTVSVWM